MKQILHTSYYNSLLTRFTLLERKCHPFENQKIALGNRSFSRYGILLIFIFLVFGSISCKKLVEVKGPITNISSANVYENDITATSVLNGIYASLSMSPLQSGGLTSMSYLAGLSSDELTFFGSDPTLVSYFTNTLSYNSGMGDQFWNNIYPDLYVVNAALEGLNRSVTLTPTVKQQLLGEASFMRAMYFFYLVNLYGDVPMVLGTDYKVNSIMSRTPKEDVWKQIIIDLKEAQALLSPRYLDASLLGSTTERVRPTKWAATALLARAYLYVHDWQNAEIQATSILNESSFGLEDLDQVFKKNSKEAIWQLQPVYKGVNTQEANSFIIVYDYDKVTISQRLYDSFEVGDQRKTKWINQITFDNLAYYYPYKYKILSTGDPSSPVLEYSTVLRLAEQYLIRAEARVQQNKISDGIDDLNVLRDRASNKASGTIRLPLLSRTMNQSNALNAVSHERQTELFSEWGHRWLDLKRTGKIDQVMNEVVPDKIKGGIWKSYQQLFPVPLSDILRDPKLVQNNGY